MKQMWGVSKRRRVLSPGCRLIYRRAASGCAPNCTARLDIDVRTVRRDIREVADGGYPSETTPGRPRVSADARAPSCLPLLLDDDKRRLRFEVDLRTAARSSVTGIEESQCGHWPKLEHLLQSRCGKPASACWPLHPRLPPPGTTVNPETSSLTARRRPAAISTTSIRLS